MVGFSTVRLIGGFTEASEVLRVEFLSVLRHVPNLGRDIKTDWVSLSDCGSCAFSIRLREDCFGYHAWDVAGVAGHVLLADLVSRPSNPVLSILAVVAKDVFIGLVVGCACLFVEVSRVSAALRESVDSLAVIGNDLPVDIACGHSEEVILGRDEAGVAWEVLFVEETLVFGAEQHAE